jgi:hypothetical protein
MRTLSHNGFARTSTVRKSAPSGFGRSCEWCGSSDRTLYCYGTEADDSGRVNWHRGAFCSKSCHNAYHG